MAETRLEDLNLDSLEIIEALFELEEVFNISLSLPQTDNMPVTVGDLDALVASRLSSFPVAQDNA